MTADIEAQASELIEKVEEIGGAVAAIEQGFQKAEIERSAYRVAREIDAGERTVVGVNTYVTPAEEEPYEPLRVDPAIEAGAVGAARGAAPHPRRRGGSPDIG